MSEATAITIDRAAASRVEMYRLVAAALAFPSPEFHAAAQRGDFRAAVREAAHGLHFELDAAAIDALITDDAYLDFQAEYIRLFDVGMVRPPCPLYGGEWGMSRRSMMEDALRFYRFFGMRLQDDSRELPDHVTVELEFMQTLAYMEGTARASGESVLPLVRAERDFLSRHPGKWWPMLRTKIERQQPSPFYFALADIVAKYLSADAADLRSRVAEAADG